MDKPFNALAMITAFTRGQSIVAMDPEQEMLSASAGGAEGQEQLLAKLAAAEPPSISAYSAGAKATWQALHGGDEGGAVHFVKGGSLPRGLNLRDASAAAGVGERKVEAS